MNLRRFYLIAILLLAFGVGTNGQEPPKAVLVDELRRTNCEELLARLDSFLQEMSANPMDRAIVVTFPDIRDATARNPMILVKSRFEESRQDDRVSLLIGKPQDALMTQFWRVPSGAQPPDLNAAEIPNPVLDLKKAFAFGYEDENQICPTFVPRKFGELILNNRGSRAHLVVRRGDRNSMESKSFAAQWLETLARDGKIPRNRIKIFYAKSDQGLTYGEFWFVPAKKK